jgi:hypothetical protein
MRASSDTHVADVNCGKDVAGEGWDNYNVVVRSRSIAPLSGPDSRRIRARCPGNEEGGVNPLWTGRRLLGPIVSAP